MEIATLVLEIVLTLGKAIAQAFASGDSSVLDKPIRELLPEELKTTIAKKLADEKAAGKFGPRS